MNLAAGTWRQGKEVVCAIQQSWETVVNVADHALQTVWVQANLGGKDRGWIHRDSDRAVVSWWAEKTYKENVGHLREWIPAFKPEHLGLLSLAILTACAPLVGDEQLHTVAVTQVTVTPKASETPPPTETPVPPTPDVFLGVSSIDQISAVPGIPAGFGGPGGQELVVWNTAEFQAHLNDRGFAPVVNEEGVVASILSLDGDRLCVGNTPEKLFNPNTASGEDTLLRSEAGVFQFGDAETGEVRVQVLSAVPLSGLPDHLTCVEAVVVDPDNPAGLGALRMLLVDRNTNSIVGEMPAAFPGSDKVEIIWTDDAPMVRVNGNELHFQFRPEFVTATPEPTETATETPDPAANKKPRYSKCGSSYRLADGRIGEFSGPPRGSDGNFLPTGLKTETVFHDGMAEFNTLSCLLDVNDKVATFGFYDDGGVLHPYRFSINNPLNSGGVYSVALCIDGVCATGSVRSPGEVAKLLRTVLDDPGRSKQMSVSVIVGLPDPRVAELARVVNTVEYQEFTDKLYQALKVGYGFPDLNSEFSLGMAEIREINN